MRLVMCVVMVAVSLVALQCTATSSDNRDDGQNTADRGEAVVTVTTTTAAQINSDVQTNQEGAGGQAKVEGGVQDNSPIGITEPNNVLNQSPNGGVQKTGDNGTPKDKQDKLERETINNNNAKEGHTVREGEDAQRENIVNGPGQRVVLSPKPSVTTTTTTKVNDKPSELPHGSHGENAQNTEGQKDIKEKVASPHVRDAVAPLKTEVKTNTTTARIQTPSGSQEDKVKEQSTPSKDGGSSDLNVTETAAVATTTTTNVPANTLPKQSKIQQSLKNKDSSSSTSLLIACAMLASLAVIPVAAV